MPSKDQFPKKPPIRFQLTKAQARKIEEAKEAGESVLVLGYSHRHPWPNPNKFTLCAWFVDPEAIQDALKASGIMAKPKPPKRKRAKRKIAPPQTRPDRRPDKKSLNKQIPINMKRKRAIDCLVIDSR